MKKQTGFTLIELVVVMVLLGILAAFAVSKFYDFGPQARAADINGLAGALTSAYITAHGAALATGATGATGTITMEGTAIALANGYPSTVGITNAISMSSAFISATAGTTITFSYKNSAGTAIANCNVSYQSAPASGTPVVTVNTGGC